jgi:hypothetical protein
MELIVSEYFMATTDVLQTVMTKVSQDAGRLLISSGGFSSSSIIIPCANSRKMTPSYSFR